MENTTKATWQKPEMIDLDIEFTDKTTFIKETFDLGPGPS
jgi:hypothetical protein